jgi:hypothetical protein
MAELEVTWARTLSVWWLIIWRGTLGSFLIGGLLGFIVGFTFGVLRTPMDPLIPAILGGVGGVIWFVVVVRMALKNQYREFQIALVPRGDRMGKVFE